MPFMWTPCFLRVTGILRELASLAPLSFCYTSSTLSPVLRLSRSHNHMASAQVEPGKPSVISLILQDHEKERALWVAYQQPNAIAAERQQLGWALIREIAMHGSAEEEVMYPEVRRRMGNEAAEHLLSHAGHQGIKDLMYELDLMTIERHGEGEYTAKLAELMHLALHHMEEEEASFWPAFEALPGVDDRLLARLGERFTAAKAHAVTRPHPWAPNKPPLNLIANPMTAPLDGLADMWRFAGNPPQ